MFGKIFLSTLFLFFTTLIIHGQEKFTYTIKGKLDNYSYDGSTVYLFKDGIYGNPVFRDSTEVRHGKFEFRGKRCEWPHMYTVSVSKELWCNVILESGVIHVEFEGGKKKLSGTPMNNQLYKDYLQPSEQVRILIDSLRQNREVSISKGIWTTKDEAEYSRKLPGEELKVLQAGKLNFIKMYAEYPVVEYFLFEMMCCPFPDKELPGILNRLPESSRKRMILKMEDYRQTMSELLKEHKKENIQDFVPDSVNVGKQFIDIRGINRQGDTLVLSKFVKNKKLYLLDFWASWCKPCMQAMPELVSLYQKYREKGLEIIGLSSDHKISAWKNAIEENRMAWPQLRVYRVKEKDALETYGIFFIPYTILFDAEGRIVARNLKGIALAEKISEMLD